MVAFNETEFPDIADAYGNTLIFTGPGPDNTWFTDDDPQSSYGASGIIYQGRVHDAESTLYYFRTRCYSPALGRFTNRNPWGYIQGRLSLYDFEKGSPVRHVEPLSAAADLVEVALAAALALLVTMVRHPIRPLTLPRPHAPACDEPPDPCPDLLKEYGKAVRELAKKGGDLAHTAAVFQANEGLYAASGTLQQHEADLQNAARGLLGPELKALSQYRELEEHHCL